MKSIAKLAAAVALAAGSLSAPLPAAAKEQAVELKGDVMLERVTKEEGGEPRVELVRPDTIVPGDKLIFSTSYSNNGASAVDNFIVTNPVPSAVRLAPDADADLFVSVDGGSTWGLLADLSVAEEGGGSRAAAHADVTHVRWTLASVAPGETGRLEYPAIIR